MFKIQVFFKRYYSIMQCVALVIAYFSTGKLGMFLAVPPGYATAIYPPSGIALAGILLLGYRAWFSVLLGSFLMNLSIAASHAPIENYTPVVIALTIAMGATLQAISGAYLVKRFADFPNPLASEKSVFKFIFFGGFLSTLINSTISVSTLVAMNQIPLSNFLTNWITWWMGDAIGVFIFAPLTLVWLYRKHDYFCNRKWSITATIMAAFSLTIMLVVFETHKESEHLKSEFDKDTLALNVALEKSITTHLTVLHSLESFYAASVSIDREEFHKFVSHALDEFKGIKALEWCPLITNSERPAFEKSMQKEGFLNFEIKVRDENQKLIRANTQEFYAPVTFVEPIKGNELAFGYNLNSTERREALEYARDTGEIATSSKITLVQDNQAGILVIAPIYKTHFPHQNLQERRQNILGYVQAVFHIDDILQDALKPINVERLHLQLFDENAPAPQHLLFSNQLASFVLNEKGLFGKNIALSSSTLISMGNRHWRFEITPTQDYFVHHHSDNAWLILLTGLVLTSVAGVFIMVSSGREMVLEKLVQERTNELIEADLELKHSNTELKKESDKNLALLRNASDGLTLVNKEANLIDCSDSFCTMLGYSREEIIGMHVSQWDTGIPKDELMHFINELFKQKTRFEFETVHIRKDGTTYDAEISGQPVRFGDEWVYFCATRDVTKRKQIELELRESEARFRAIIDISPVPIALNDDQQNIIFLNHAFIETFGYDLNDIPTLEIWWQKAYPDLDYRQWVIETWQATLEQAKREQKAFVPFEIKVCCKNGSQKIVLASAAMVAEDENNLHLVILYDITEREEMEKELKRSNADLEQFAYAVSHDMRQPLRMVTSYLTLIEKALEKQLDDDTRQCLTFAVDGAKRMDSMILSLLDYSRVGRQSIEFSVISSRAAVDEALLFVKPALESCGGKVDISGDWIDLVASRDELTRLLQNLIGNALKYHNENNSPVVEISATVTTNIFRVAVRDNGIGIEPSQQNRLFKVFSRLQTRGRFEGTGVGLALCRKIVEHHGGTIGVTSEGEGLGSVFWFELPRKQIEGVKA